MLHLCILKRELTFWDFVPRKVKPFLILTALSIQSHLHEHFNGLKHLRAAEPILIIGQGCQQ